MTALRSQILGLIAESRRIARHAQNRLLGPGELLPDGLERYGIPGRHVFFGYYDVTPFDTTNTRLLGMSAPRHNRSPAPGEMIDIGYFVRGVNDGFHKIGETSAWCWQQGCRLRWLPQSRDELIVYNVAGSDGFEATIRSVETGREEQHLPLALYDISADGTFGLALDFARLGVYRPGYGYAWSQTSASIKESAPSDQYISRVELSSGRVTQLVSLAAIAATAPSSEMIGAAHYLNHISISPTASHFLFYHFWAKGARKDSRVCVFRLSTGELSFLDLGPNVSHYAWINDDLVLMFCRPPGENKKKYWIVDVRAGPVCSFDSATMQRDGHPTVLSGSQLILTDTYPDAVGHQAVLLHDVILGSTKVVARFYNPSSFRNEVRCDLHPRLSPDERWICVDSSRDGGRALYVVPLTRADR